MLVSALIVAVGLIGELPEAKTWKSWAFAALVTAGVIGELIADGVLFGASERLQALSEDAIGLANTKAVAALTRAAIVEQAAAWRILDPATFAKLHRALADNTGRPITIGFAVGDPETIAFTGQIFAAFQATTWSPVPVGHWYESVIVQGVRVLGSDTEGTKLIERALAAADIPFTHEGVPVPPTYNNPASGVPDETKLFLYIGTKARPNSSRTQVHPNRPSRFQTGPLPIGRKRPLSGDLHVRFDERHRQTKGAATDMFDLQPPRHIPTLPSMLNNPESAVGSYPLPPGWVLLAAPRQVVDTGLRRHDVRSGVHNASGPSGRSGLLA